MKIPSSSGDTANLCVTWQCPSNIALVKYWGKKPGQLPASPSLSMTLNHAVTQTSVTVLDGSASQGLLSVNGDPGHPFLPKMQQLLLHMAEELPVLNRVSLAVTTENSFPHSTGIASSASGIGAFALCLLSIGRQLMQQEISSDELLHLASRAARMGSGSACRSLYGGYSAWGETAGLQRSSDEYAIPVSALVHPEMLKMRDAILVISSSPKSMPSTLGHKSMEGHPFYTGRIAQANQNMEEMLKSLAGNDFEKLCIIAEGEALTLHALMMSASPGIMLMLPSTVEVIHRVRYARKSGLPLCFTLDAGANVHVLYPDKSAGAVEAFISDALGPLCEGGRIIFDSCGGGPVRLTESAGHG